MNRNYVNNDDDNLEERNIIINTNSNMNTSKPLLNNLRNNEKPGQTKNEINNEENYDSNENNFAYNFVNNPKEAIAKELMNQAEQKSKGWFDRFKCNFK
jgi:hypothetical protein